MFKTLNNDNRFLSKLKQCNYVFIFISLYPPFILNYLKFSTCLNNKNKKILIKQSYMVLTWFYYLSFITKNKQSSDTSNNKIKITSLPLKKKKFTATRAPIAHKTWSKEQYLFQFYKFKISFKSSMVTNKFNNNNQIYSINSGLIFIIITKKLFPQLETNLFFLKTYKFFFYLQDDNYFNYFKFLNQINN